MTLQPSLKLGPTLCQSGPTMQKIEAGLTRIIPDYSGTGKSGITGAPCFQLLGCFSALELKVTGSNPHL